MTSHHHISSNFVRTKKKNWENSQLTPLLKFWTTINFDWKVKINYWSLLTNSIQIIQSIQFCMKPFYSQMFHQKRWKSLSILTTRAKCRLAHGKNCQNGFAKKFKENQNQKASTLPDTASRRWRMKAQCLNTQKIKNTKESSITSKHRLEAKLRMKSTSQLHHWLIVTTIRVMLPYLVTKVNHFIQITKQIAGSALTLKSIELFQRTTQSDHVTGAQTATIRRVGWFRAQMTTIHGKRLMKRKTVQFWMETALFTLSPWTIQNPRNSNIFECIQQVQIGVIIIIWHLNHLKFMEYLSKLSRMIF